MLRRSGMVIVVLLVLSFWLNGVAQSDFDESAPYLSPETPDRIEPEPQPERIPIICWDCLRDCRPKPGPEGQWKLVESKTQCLYTQRCGMWNLATFRIKAYHRVLVCKECTCCLWIPVSCKPGWVERDDYKWEYEFLYCGCVL